MNFNKYHVSRNLLFEKNENRSINGFGAFTIDNDYDLWLGEVVAGQTCTISNMDYVYGFFATKPMPNTGITYDGSRGYEASGTVVVTVPSGCTWVAVRVLHNANNAMLNTGTTALPYEPYSSEVWHDTPHYIHKTDTDTITTPAVLYPNDTTATVGLKGNTSQSGRPTPTAPIQPQECGERTGNLFDYVAYFDSTFTAYNEFFNYATIQLKPNTTYTLSTSIIEQGSNPRNTAFIVATTNQTPTTASGGLSNVSPITITTESDGVLKLYKRISGRGVIPTKAVFDNGDWIMLNLGSTALPYEPYGYKIPISSADTTTPVYLGEVQTTRRVKKLVLTGEENFTEIASGLYRITENGYMRSADTLVGVCSHFGGGYTVGAAPSAKQDTLSFLVSASGNNYMYFSPLQYLTTNDFKSYLAQEYAAGTPVTIWYVLATPETAVVNEPLRKIGNYADEVSGITIPTIAGANTISVDTTLQPSEVTVNYKGWHPVQSVYERENGQWD